ncbi:lysophospholipase [Nannochloropsis oceanica]
MGLLNPFLASVTHVRARVPLLLVLAMISSSLAACPGSPFTFHFRVRANKGQSRNAADKAVANVEDFFSTTQLPSTLFVTSTTMLQDLCDSSIETLSVSTKSASDAVMRAMGNEDRSTGISSKGRGKPRLFVVVAVSGTPGLSAIDTKQVSNSLRTLLAENGIRATVTASVQRGPATISNLRLGANAARIVGVKIPARTHTFQEYVALPTFKAYTPVIVADADFRGDISQDIVALSNGVALEERCSVTNVYRSPRRADDWTLLSRAEARMFIIRSSQAGRTVRLRLNMRRSKYYWRLRGNKNLSKNSKSLGAMQAFWSGIGVKLVGKDTDSIVSSSRLLRNNNQRELDGISLNSTKGLNDEELSFHTDNYAAADYSQEYAIVFKCGSSSAPLRMDLAVVPRVRRSNGVSRRQAPATSMTCLPGSTAQGLSRINSAVPLLSASSADCPVFPKRSSSASRVLDNATFDELHPEEKEWVAQRLLKTGPKLASFIEQNLFALDPSARTDLKVAIAVSGGGKRSLFNAAGVTSNLAQAGVLDLATWMAGSSGGSWLLGGLYGASLGKEGLIDPATFISARMPDLTKAVFDGTFRANDILTNFGINGGVSLPVAPFAFQDSAATTTANILCQSELKFQSPATKASQAGSPALSEYWGRALAYQMLGAPFQDGGMGLTMSGLLLDGLVGNHNAPLPLMLLQNAQGSAFRFWEVSPFDVGVHKGEVHVSYPTALLGTDAEDPNKRCTTQIDQVSWLMGVSGWIFPLAQEYRGGTLQSVVCGEAGSACQPVLINNPFVGHGGPSSQAAAAEGMPDLFTSAETKVLDGAATYNNPVWPFVTPTRQADVVIVIDSSGSKGGKTFDAPISTGPEASCATDSAPGASASCASNLYYEADGGLNNKCCSTCEPLLDNACWPTADPVLNDLFRLSELSEEHTLPADIPKPGFTNPRHTTQVSFFGCREPNVTAIVYVPNRVVSSGKSGFTALRSALGLNQIFGIPADPLQAADVDDIVRNGQDQLKASDFRKCLACLFAASLSEQDRMGFWATTSQCTSCLEAYCQG